MADIEYDDSLLATSENLAAVSWDDLEGGGKLSVANTPHLCLVKKVGGYLYNFKNYTGPRAKIMLQVVDGPDKGKTQHDDISLPHPQESDGSRNRRVLIASRLGLITKGSKETAQIDWKRLEGHQVLITVEDKLVTEGTYKGKTFANVTFDGWADPAMVPEAGAAARATGPGKDTYSDI